MQNELILAVLLNVVWTKYTQIHAHTHTNTHTIIHHKARKYDSIWNAKEKSSIQVLKLCCAVHHQRTILVTCIANEEKMKRTKDRRGKKRKKKKQTNEIKQLTQEKFGIVLRNVDVCHDLMRLNRCSLILNESNVSESMLNPKYT